MENSSNSYRPSIATFKNPTGSPFNTGYDTADPLIANYLKFMKEPLVSRNIWNDRSKLKGYKIIEYGTCFQNLQCTYPRLSVARMWSKDKNGNWSYGFTGHMQDGDQEELTEKYTVSILVNGFLPSQPIILDRYGSVLDGRIRVMVCKQLRKDFCFIRYNIDFPEQTVMEDKRNGDYY